jgi:predicted nucleotidyltransferase
MPAPAGYTGPMSSVDDLLSRLRVALTNAPPLRLAILFGSAADDALRADSDVDVGIVPRQADLLLATELDLQTRLERVCGRPVDLVRLDRAPTLLRWEAARTGIPILADPAPEFARFVASAALEHAELMPTLAFAAERFRQRLASAAPGVIAGESTAD